MRVQDGGYSALQYDSKQLRKTAKLISERLPQLMEETGADAVAVTGKSGISLAFATLMLIDFPLIVVRKGTEPSHGLRVEGRPGIDIHKYLILDDFISSGKTVIKIITEINDAATRNHYTPALCVGVLEYATSSYCNKDVEFKGTIIKNYSLEW